MKIYTKTGDEGTTGLFGGGRVSKTHPRIEAYGTVDETNSFIGLALAHLSDTPEGERIRACLEARQDELFILGADLATPSESRAQTARIDEEHVSQLEREIDELAADLPPLKNFILPGGTRAAAALHAARAICRRAERLVLKAAEAEAISSSAVIYLNRLSDYLFVMARWVNQAEGAQESTWKRQT